MTGLAVIYYNFEAERPKGYIWRTHSIFIWIHKGVVCGLPKVGTNQLWAKALLGSVDQHAFNLQAYFLKMKVMANDETLIKN
jgi:hypothetical protein